MNRVVRYLLPEYWLISETYHAMRLAFGRSRNVEQFTEYSTPAYPTYEEETAETIAASETHTPDPTVSAHASVKRKGGMPVAKHPDFDWLEDITSKPRPKKIVYTESDLERDLAEIIGLENVKNTIRDIYYTVRTNQERQASGLETSGQLLHMMFYGNPGTGKTTVARLVGRMFREMGVLSRGHFVEVEASDLIAGYVGQTGPKTQAKIREALGGVLFIDEAYALVPEEDTRNSFGPEAIAVLIKTMEDHRDNLCVILAGYEDEMKRLFRVNPGLRSRVPFVLHFPDYTPPELLRIFVAEAAKRQYRIERDGGEYLLELFTTYQANMRELGNGRFARNVLERAILAQSRRLGALGRKPTPVELMLLTLEDLMAWEKAGGGHA